MSAYWQVETVTTIAWGGRVHAEHTIWRCKHCRALAVTPYPSSPGEECKKCHRR